MTIISGSYQQKLQFAAQKLLAGDVIAIPTETVYGLAALLSKEAAVKKIYTIKGRPSYHPLIMHIAKIEDLYRYAINIPEYVEELIKTFWPGPLTFILKKSDKTPNYITGNQDTVAIRMPSNKFTFELIDLLNEPIVAPSANKFMGISPTRAEHVLSEFGEDIYIIDQGPCTFGIESTIIDATEMDNFRILRPGSITGNDIYSKIGHHNMDNINKVNMNIMHSGKHKKHYSPKKMLLSFKNMDELNAILLSHKKVCVIKYSEIYNKLNLASFINISSSAQGFAYDLYHILRVADEDKDINTIAIEEPPMGNEWESVWDRLTKAKYLKG